MNYLHASHAENRDESKLLVSTHIESLDEENGEYREAKVADSKNGRHYIGEGYDNVHADAFTCRSKCSGPEEIDWIALEHCKETVHHAHHNTSVDNDVSGATKELLRDRRISEQ